MVLSKNPLKLLLLLTNQLKFNSMPVLHDVDINFYIEINSNTIIEKLNIFFMNEISI